MCRIRVGHKRAKAAVDEVLVAHLKEVKLYHRMFTKHGLKSTENKQKLDKNKLEILQID